MVVAVKVAQAERNTKQIYLFLFTTAIVTAPIGLMPVLGGAILSPILKTELQLAGSRL